VFRAFCMTSEIVHKIISTLLVQVYWWLCVSSCPPWFTDKDSRASLLVPAILTFEHPSSWQPSKPSSSWPTFFCRPLWFLLVVRLLTPSRDLQPHPVESLLETPRDVGCRIRTHDHIFVCSKITYMFWNEASLLWEEGSDCCQLTAWLTVLQLFTAGLH
jgi:hypothetical protein